MSAATRSTADLLAALAGVLAMAAAIVGIPLAGLLAWFTSGDADGFFFWSLAAIILGCANFLVGWGLVRRTLAPVWAGFPLATSLAILSPILWLGR